MPNADGTYTYVIAARDPGVHNWIDTDGLREGILTLRMAEFGPTAGHARTSRHAAGWSSSTDLDTELPDLARVDERRPGRPARRPARAGYLRRLPEEA